MSPSLNPQLVSFSSDWLSRPVLPAISQLAEAIRANHNGVAAVLAYGSCLRGDSIRDTLVDFYVLTDDLNGVSSNAFSRLGCAIAPPNVYYFERSFDKAPLRAKYAVLPLHLFARWMQPNTNNPYFWARFSQPSALVYARDSAARTSVSEAIATAISTCFANAKGVSQTTDPLEIWAQGFRATYGSEWRSEGQGRADQIVATYPDYYRRASELLSATPPISANQSWRKFTGKLWATLRLAKASFTFQGGADYLAWKIERHSGVKIEITDWQRRHPIIAGLMMLVSLRRRGAIR